RWSHCPKPKCARSHASTGPRCWRRWARPRRLQPMSELAKRVDCGPEGCTLDWLVSERHEIDDDPVAFQKLATDAGWGDGLPLIPPTEERVRAFVAASGHFPDETIAEIPPRNGRGTIEKLAVNAVIAGPPPASRPALIPAVGAVSDPAVYY